MQSENRTPQLQRADRINKRRRCAFVTEENNDLIHSVPKRPNTGVDQRYVVIFNMLFTYIILEVSTFHKFMESIRFIMYI